MCADSSSAIWSREDIRPASRLLEAGLSTEVTSRDAVLLPPTNERFVFDTDLLSAGLPPFSGRSAAAAAKWLAHPHYLDSNAEHCTRHSRAVSSTTGMFIQRRRTLSHINGGYHGRWLAPHDP